MNTVVVTKVVHTTTGIELDVDKPEQFKAGCMQILKLVTGVDVSGDRLEVGIEGRSKNSPASDEQ